MQTDWERDKQSGRQDSLSLCLSKAFQKYKEMTYETFFKIFDSKVQPI